MFHSSYLLNFPPPLPSSPLLPSPPPLPSLPFPSPLSSLPLSSPPSPSPPFLLPSLRLCASISAQYEQREVFDNLIIQLSKFTSLLQPHEQPQTFTIAQILNTDFKSRLSLETLLSLAHSHGNLLREGWKNILDCLNALFGARLLPEGMVKIKDFLADGGSISLYTEEAPTVRSVLLIQYYSNFLINYNNCDN